MESRQWIEIDCSLLLPKQRGKGLKEGKKSNKIAWLGSEQTSLHSVEWWDISSYTMYLRHVVVKLEITFWRTQQMLKDYMAWKKLDKLLKRFYEFYEILWVSLSHTLFVCERERKRDGGRLVAGDFSRIKGSVIHFTRKNCRSDDRLDKWE